MQGVVRVIADLDRDLHQIPDNHLLLVINACDTGVPKLCDSRNMVIRIADVNDNTPNFTRAVYTASISQTAAADEEVLMIGAQVSKKHGCP